MRSMTLPRAVSMTIGMRLDSRTLRQTAKPSIPGSITSRTTMSGGSALSARSPSSGWATARTAKPNWPRYSVSSAFSASSSSMTSTRAPVEEWAAMVVRSVVRSCIIHHSAVIPQSFRSQGLDRRQQRGPAGREGAEAEPGGAGHRQRRAEGRERQAHLPLRAEGDGRGSERARGDPGHPPAERQDRGLGEELDEDVARPRADRHAQADLAGPLPDREEHEREDPRPADQERED